MKYKSGIEVLVGDVIGVMHDVGLVEGIVLNVLIAGTPEAAEWARPNGGVLIEGGGIGLFVNKPLEDEEEIVFLRRASSKL